MLHVATAEQNPGVAQRPATGMFGEVVSVRESVHLARSIPKQVHAETVEPGAAREPVHHRVVGVIGAPGLRVLMRANAPPGALVRRPAASVVAEPETVPVLANGADGLDVATRAHVVLGQVKVKAADFVEANQEPALEVANGADGEAVAEKEPVLPTIPKAKASPVAIVEPRHVLEVVAVVVHGADGVIGRAAMDRVPAPPEQRAARIAAIAARRIVHAIAPARGVHGVHATHRPSVCQETQAQKAVAIAVLDQEIAASPPVHGAPGIVAAVKAYAPLEQHPQRVAETAEPSPDSAPAAANGEATVAAAVKEYAQQAILKHKAVETAETKPGPAIVAAPGIAGAHVADKANAHPVP